MSKFFPFLFLFISFFSSCLFFNREYAETNDLVPHFVLEDDLQRNSKRGISYNNLTTEQVTALANGNVTWAYNWFRLPENEFIGPDKKLAFLPMSWGTITEEEEAELRGYLEENSGVQYLLGYNEPNMGFDLGGCYTTPEVAAEHWPRLEKLAQEFNLKLVSPALTYGFEPLQDGVIYGTPESWMDAFIQCYKEKNQGKEPTYDYLALHSYMAWPSAVIWFCDKYAEMYGKQIFLTEFCAWQNDGVAVTEDWQAQTMAQKIEALDKNPNVAGYAWFMAESFYKERPWNSLFVKKDGKYTTEMTLAGLIYTHLLASESKYFGEGQGIPAVSYTASSNYNTTVGEKNDSGERFASPFKFEKSSDSVSYNQVPLVFDGLKDNAFVTYQIDVPKTGEYIFTLRYLSDGFQLVSINGNSYAFEKTNGKWKNYTVKVALTEGKQQVTIKGCGNISTAKLAWLCFNVVQ